jgi:GrpB-like predicted nucleotidyltransferase (UPF0157 family)
MQTETLEQRIARLVEEEVEIRPYDPNWVELFDQESKHLRSCLPKELIRRIEHFGSTAVPGLAAKPIVDMLVEVTDLKRTKQEVAPLLESQGYDYFWRPTRGDDGLPFYAWFIKRYPYTGERTHHIHMVESGEPFSVHWERLLFRDYLIANPRVAKEYEVLKRRLATEFPRDRVKYTQAKTTFIERVMRDARGELAGAAQPSAAELGR